MTTNLLDSGKISPLVRTSSMQIESNRPLVMQKLASSPTPDSVKKVIYNPPQKSTVKIEEISENYLPRKKLIMDTIVSDDGKILCTNKLEMPTKNNQSLFAIPGNMPSQSLKPIHSSSNSLKKCNPMDQENLSVVNKVLEEKSLGSILNVKIEENSELPKIRKKICRKMLKIFHEEFNIDRKDAKRLTLQLESRFNLLFSFKNEKYVNTIGKFFKN